MTREERIAEADRWTQNLAKILGQVLQAAGVKIAAATVMISFPLEDRPDDLKPGEPWDATMYSSRATVGVSHEAVKAHHGAVAETFAAERELEEAPVPPGEPS
jgi:hypothetical protein